MPRKSKRRGGQGPKVYRKPDGEVLWCSFTIDGNRFRRSTGEVDPRQAESAARTIWLGELENAGRTSPERGADVNMTELVAEYLAWRTKRGRGAVSYLAKLEESYRHHVLSRFDKLGSVTRVSWSKAVAEMRNSGLSWSTVARQTTYLNVLLKWALAEGKANEIPKLQLPESKAIKREQKKRRALSITERDAVLHHLSGAALRWYTVAFWTGMRFEEINHMPLRWIDFERGMIVIPASDQKSGEDEEPIDLPERAAAAIREQVASTGVIDRGTPIFGPRNYYKSWRRAVRLAGVDPHGLTAHHTARHTCLTELGANGGPTALLAVMAQGRHKDPKTSQKYVHSGVHLAKVARAQAEATAHKGASAKKGNQRAQSGDRDKP